MTAEFELQFGAMAFGDVSSDAASNLASFETKFSGTLPELLREILIHFGAAVIFQKDVKYKPIDRTFLEDSDGYHTLEILYGPAKNLNGLVEKNETYQDQIPIGLIVIGESPGGNQVCLDKLTGRLFFWHHEAANDEESLFEIAPNFADFLKGLHAEDALPAKPDGIIKDKSFLNF